MIPEQIPVNNHFGNNEATQFDFDFYIENETQLKVTHTDFEGNETYPVLGVDYSIKSVGKKNGSYIEFPLADSKYKVLGWDLTTNQKELLTIELNIPIEQPAEYQMSGKLSLKNIENSFDYLTRICQILHRLLDRALKVSESVADMNMNLPLPIPNNVFKWNETGTSLENYDIIGENNAFKSKLLSDVDKTQTQMKATIDKNKEDTNKQISDNKVDTDEQISEFKAEVNTTIEIVSEAAQKINQLEQAVEDANNSAQTASEKALDVENMLTFATSDMNNKLSDANNAVEKAKAQVELITQKADSIANAIVNKANIDLSNLTSEGNAKLHYPVFCFNSGLVDEQGQAELCSIENDILTQHAPCVCTTSDGQTFIINEDVTLDISTLEDGEYNVFYYPETKELKAFKNTIFVQDARPENFAENDIWVDTSVMPFITRQYISGVEEIIRCVQNARLIRVSGGGKIMVLPYNYTSSVRKSGDTMTGSLDFNMPEDNASNWQSNIKCNNIEIGKAPASNQYRGIRFWDKTGRDLGGLQVRYATTGELALSLTLQNTVGTNYNAVSMCADKNGNIFGTAPNPQINDSSNKIATTSFCDGVWVSKSFTVINNGEYSAANKTYTFNLSSYLPNDGRVYEVIFQTGMESTNGYGMYFLSSALCANAPIGRCQQSNSKYAASTVVIPIGTDRKLYLKSNGSSTGSIMIGLYARSYRKVR